MWYQQYNPLGNEIVSGIIAFLPILLFLLSLTIFKLKGVYAAALTLGVTIIITVGVFDMPITKAFGAILLGTGKALWPIGYIVIMAVWLYKISVQTGKFEIVRGSIANITEDQRLQLLLIGFCFNAFLEGAAGLGVPIAICAALLVTLGFHPIKAAGLCLIANASTGAFGTVGIPVITGAEVGGMETIDLSRMTALILPLISFLVPFLLIFILNGLKGIKEIFPAIFLVSSVFSVLQLLTIATIGPELANIIPSLVSMLVLAAFLRKWQPKMIYHEPGVEVTGTLKIYTMKEIMVAWSPFYLLTGVIAVWSLPAFKNLFVDGGALDFTTIALKIPGLHNEIIRTPPIVTEANSMPAILHVNFVSATGTAILLAIILTSVLFPVLNLKQTVNLLGGTIKELWLPIFTIVLVMAFANLSDFSGLSTSLGLALAKTADFFPFVSPVLGWIGVFLTGSVVNNNALFGSLQVVTGTQIGISPGLLMAANTAGGSVAKLISPQSIAIAAAAVNQTGNESKIFQYTLRYSLGLLLLVCIMTLCLSYIMI
ncbi:lactate permease LctP family transporter [Lysinibacillus xylanilyticus]|uniref:L-lactate permease n=1 Tax=Lysinibacillus xylanilyticus TaxID=582475 RepID=A0ABT4ET41_9BACI|nr:lactate permease LctP family transporter [Lysinibacillus xylanilyticus]MCY9548801.1 lactate permease LctP family transporter [Lysinibacillus xylanilyticus]